MSYDFGGHLDHGCLYAANSFFDPQSQKQVVWGWVTEEDLCDELRHAQGWSGMLSMPRELRMQTINHVFRASSSRLNDITAIELQPEGDNLFTVRTLASQPLQRLTEALRRGPNVRRADLGRSKLDQYGIDVSFTSKDVRTDQWELKCSFCVSKECRTAGLSIENSQDGSQATTLTFDPSSETFTIDRPSFAKSNTSALINSSPETAPHTLFSIRDLATGAEEMETLDIHAWRDNSVLEVFVNGRTAISTRIYAANETFGVRFFADDETPRGTLDSSVAAVGTQLVFAKLWDGISIA